MSHKPAVDGKHVIANAECCVDNVGHLKIKAKLKLQNTDYAVKWHGNILSYVYDNVKR